MNNLAVQDKITPNLILIMSIIFSDKYINNCLKKINEFLKIKKIKSIKIIDNIFGVILSYINIFFLNL